MTAYSSLAEQARSLLANDAFLKAMAGIKEAARDGLCAADPADADTIRKHQTTVSVVEDILDSLRHQQNAGKGKPPGIA